MVRGFGLRDAEADRLQAPLPLAGLAPPPKFSLRFSSVSQPTASSLHVVSFFTSNSFFNRCVLTKTSDAPIIFPRNLGIPQREPLLAAHNKDRIYNEGAGALVILYSSLIIFKKFPEIRYL